MAIPGETLRIQLQDSDTYSGHWKIVLHYGSPCCSGCTFVSVGDRHDGVCIHEERITRPEAVAMGLPDPDVLRGGAHPIFHLDALVRALQFFSNIYPAGLLWDVRNDRDEDELPGDTGKSG